MDLSIVTTMYYSAPYLHEFHSRASAAAQKLTDEYEIIYVNDGSPDESIDVALSLYEQDDHVRVIDLSRNFGHHKAIVTGLTEASGDLVFLLDVDLEEEPEWLEDFVAKMQASGADLVYGVQRARKGRFFERVSGDLFYRAFNFMSSAAIAPNQVTARLMTRRFVDSLIVHQDREVFLAGLMVLTGFGQTQILVNKHSKGSTTYTLGRRLALLVNAITSFSSKPLVYIFYLGCAVTLLAGAAALYLIIRRVFFQVYLTGWPSLIVSVWLLGGLMIFCLGVIGIYLSKVFLEVKQRPYTVIRELYARTGASGREL